MTIPTEVIPNLIKCVEAFPFDKPHVLSMAEKMLLLDALAELLAVREAQPVLLWKMEHWRDAPCNGVEWAKGYFAGWNKYHDLVSNRLPAEQVAPIEMTGALAMTKYGIKRSNYTQWVKGWNACRAAMLAAAPTPTK